MTPEPMTDIRQKVAREIWGADTVNVSLGHQRLIELAAREMAILIRERLTEGDYHTGDVELAVIDDLLASLVSAETQVQDEKVFARSDQSGRSTADLRVDDRGGSWHPIETAPKDGSKLMLWCVDLVGGNGRVATGSWHDTFNGSWWDWGMEYTLNPTHWMPLPSPPETP